MEIKLKDISFKYPNKEYILKNINITIESNKITGIIGKNGSGKTTLLELISNLLTPTNGTITYNKKDIDKKHIGYIFQNPKSMFFKNTVKEEIELGSLVYNYRVKDLDKRIKEVLKIVKLKENILNKNPFELTNNESKKVALASILIYNPRIIILDEPTLNLDYKTKKELIILLKLLKNKYNKTIVVVSHDIDLINELCDNIILLNNGEIIDYNTKFEVLKNVKELKQCGLLPPKTILFSEKVLNKKGIKLGYRTEINDLIKDIYRNVY